MNKRGYLSLIQVVILVLGVVAIAYALGSEVEVVRGEDTVNKYDVKKGDTLTELAEEYGTTIKVIKDANPGYTFGTGNQEDWIYTGTKLNIPNMEEQEIKEPTGRDLPSSSLPSFWSTRSPVDNLHRLANDPDANNWNYNQGDTTYVAKARKNGDVVWTKNGEVVNKDKAAELNAETGMSSIGGMATLTSGDFWIKNVGGNLLWAVGTYSVVQMLGSTFLGLDEEQTDAFSLAASTGLFVGRTVTDFMSNTKYSGSATTWGVGAGLLVAAYIYYDSYEDKEQLTITYTCAPWEAPSGGKYCEECNKQNIPCSEYQCNSLGQACELLNPNTNESKCAWVNENDAAYPIITLNEKELTTGCEYSNTNAISPPDRGVIILYKEGEEADTSGCIPPFTPIQFGITTDEPSKCRISTERKNKFDEMGLYFGGSSTFKYNHTQQLILPDPDELGEGVEIKNNGEFDLYVRCADANGNYNTANYVFRYCVQKGPDLTAPIIRKTSINTGTPVAYNTSSMSISLYTNEPATCKWDFNNKDYETMEYELSSSSRPNNELLYESSGEITGIGDDKINNYYFRCKDSSENSNQESKKIQIIGTLPMTIDSVEPNDTSIRDSVSPAKVDLIARTRGGYDGGKSICYYSDEENGDYIQFSFEEVEFKRVNTQDLYLSSGNKTYYIKCIDKAGNEDISRIDFEVQEDKGAPQVARVYKEGSYLKLITNEASSCVYDTKNCDYEFNQGINMSKLGEDRHFVDWNTDANFYIKCQDEFKNRPLPSECTIVVKPTKTLEQV